MKVTRTRQNTNDTNVFAIVYHEKEISHDLPKKKRRKRRKEKKYKVEFEALGKQNSVRIFDDFWQGGTKKRAWLVWKARKRGRAWGTNEVDGTERGRWKTRETGIEINHRSYPIWYSTSGVSVVLRFRVSYSSRYNGTAERYSLI